MNASDAHAACFDAANAQRARLGAAQPPADRWAGRTAPFRRDPHRAPEGALLAIASYVEPDDVVVDVGGGAGRLALPLALHCREVINVDPSPAMRAEFEASAAEAGITNARFLAAAWLDTPSVEGDLVLTANVTYFIRDIVPFIEKLERTARRRVLIYLLSSQPAMQVAAVHRLVHGEDSIPPPGFRELLPVLWEMGILPDVRVLPAANLMTVGWPQPTREETIASALARIGAAGERSARLIEAHFDELFTQDAEGFWPPWPRDVHELLITWESRKAGDGGRKKATHRR